MRTKKTCLLAVVLVLLTAIGVSAQAPVAPPPAAAPQLTREHELELQVFVLKVENAQLKANLAKTSNDALSLEAQLISAQLSAEQKNLGDKVIRALGGDPTKGDTFNWQAKTLVRAAPPASTKEIKQ